MNFKELRITSEMMDYVDKNKVECFFNLQYYAKEHNPEWEQVLFQNAGIRKCMVEYIKSSNNR